MDPVPEVSLSWVDVGQGSAAIPGRAQQPVRNTTGGTADVITNTPSASTYAGSSLPDSRKVSPSLSSVVDAVRIRVSSTVGVIPLLISFQAIMPKSMESGAHLLWTIDGDPISNGMRGQKVFTRAGHYELGVIVTAASGREYRSSQKITVLETSAKGNVTPDVINPAPLLGVGSGESKEITLNLGGLSCWQNSGVTATKGRSYHVTAEGCILGTSSCPSGGCCVDANGVNDLGAGPTPNAPTGFCAPGLILYSMVARISGGTPFQLGSDVCFVASASGRLELSFNDGWLVDNSGRFSVTVSESAGVCKPSD